MESYVVGIDGGGTKTAMEVRCIDGNVLFRTIAGSLNINSSSEADIKSTLYQLVTEISHIDEEFKNCKTVCIATAGISNPTAKEFFTSTLREFGLSCEIIVVGDQEGALYGALGKAEGIVLISGTGSICFGKNKAGKSVRAGGYGHLIDDEGSGYAIGRDILRNAVKSYDKRIPKSILYDLVLGQIAGRGVDDIIEYTYNKSSSKKHIAALAPLLLEGLKQNDPAAKIICNNAAEELVNLVLTVAKELKITDGEIAFVGGILTNYLEIRNIVINLLQEALPGITVISPKYDSATGASLIALENNDNIINKRNNKQAI